MKLSIRWIFDHIQAQWSEVDISRLVTLFNEKTAEIEHVEHVITDPYSFFMVKAVEKSSSAVKAECSELQKTVMLTDRSDVLLGAYYMIKKEADQYRWATLIDWGSEKEGLLSCVYLDEQAVSGAWRELFESEDYVIHVDNKSVTHRPDLWGHRGFAREIAALLDFPFKAESEFIVKKATISTEDAPEGAPIAVFPAQTVACKRFAGLYFNMIEHRASSVWMAHRLARIDARPIDLIVDVTNYVMFDTSQPLHAFDAHALTTRKIVALMAHQGESLELLDGQKIELTEHDIVISDGLKPLALAGIMGGRETGVTSKTTALFLESAHFDATTIRRTSTRFKTRTEASARFEKTLDPNQNITGIQRFLKLLDNEGVAYEDSSDIISFGKPFEPVTIEISHDFIESKIGTSIEPSFVVNTLKKIQFGVSEHNGIYIVTVPTFRATKDVAIKEDIVEEIVRFYGYSVVTPQLPEKQTKAHSLDHVYRIRSLKELCAYSMLMRELCNYAFFDESFLQELNWQPQHAVSIKNPVSENYQRLVTTLIPGLLKGLATNPTYKEVRFFEWGRVWEQASAIIERYSLAGIFFDKNEVDFYAVKELLSRLFNFLHMDVEWRKVDEPQDPWFMPYQTAELIVGGVSIGVAGKLNRHAIATVVQGDAFAFELDGDALLAYAIPTHEYVAPSRYPAVERDISLLVPLQLTVQEITEAIQEANSSISAIHLIDMFEKKEWRDRRSLTFSFAIKAADRTLTKEDADQIVESVVTAVTALGAEVR